MSNLRMFFNMYIQAGISSEFVNFVKLNYRAYVLVCSQYNIEPKSFEEWLDEQS